MFRVQRYISDELTHFVGRRSLNDAEAQYTTFLKIIRSGLLSPSPANPTAGAPPLVVKLNEQFSRNEMYVPRVVCFCDIPAEDLGLHASKYGTFGLAFRKTFLVEKGANPAFYIARNSAVEVLRDLGELGLHVRDLAIDNPREGLLKKVPRAEHFDQMVLTFHEVSQLRTRQEISAPSGWGEKSWRVDQFLTFEIFSYLKFFDETKPDEDPDNFYMEREWRVLGNVQFSLDNVSRVILPEGFAKRFREDVPEYYKQVTFI